MSAQYRVTLARLSDRASRDVYVSSADAKSFKRADIKAANAKAVVKAKAKLAKEPLYADYTLCIGVLCVG